MLSLTSKKPLHGRPKGCPSFAYINHDCELGSAAANYPGKVLVKSLPPTAHHVQVLFLYILTQWAKEGKNVARTLVPLHRKYFCQPSPSSITVAA